MRIVSLLSSVNLNVYTRPEESLSKGTSEEIISQSVVILIFPSIFIAQISKINAISEDEAERVLDEINLELDYEDLGKKFYERLTATSGIKLIDFENFKNKLENRR